MVNAFVITITENSLSYHVRTEPVAFLNNNNIRILNVNKLCSILKLKIFDILFNFKNCAKMAEKKSGNFVQIGCFINIG